MRTGTPLKADDQTALLAAEIVEIAAMLNVVDGTQPLTGPQLLLVLSDIKKAITALIALNRVEQRKVDEFIRRYKAKPEPIDNSRLPAGSPMYFYCRACGTYITSLPENYLTTPPRYCEACEDLKKVALLDEALRRANEKTID